MYSLC